MRSRQQPEFHSKLEEVSEKKPDPEEMFKQMQRDLVAVLLALKAKLLGTRPAAAPDQFTFEINISEEVRKRLEERRGVIEQAAREVRKQDEAELNQFAALHLACIADPVIGRKMMPRSAPFFGKLRESIAGARTLPYDAPVLSGFASIVSLFPPDGLGPARIGNVLVSSKLSFTPDERGLRFDITFSNAEPVSTPEPVS